MLPGAAGEAAFRNAVCAIDGTICGGVSSPRFMCHGVWEGGAAPPWVVGATGHTRSCARASHLAKESVSTLKLQPRASMDNRQRQRAMSIPAMPDHLDVITTRFPCQKFVHCSTESTRDTTQSINRSTSDREEGPSSKSVEEESWIQVESVSKKRCIISPSPSLLEKSLKQMINEVPMTSVVPVNSVSDSAKEKNTKQRPTTLFM